MDMLVLRHFTLRLLPIGCAAPLRRPLFYLCSSSLSFAVKILFVLLVRVQRSGTVPRMLRYTYRWPYSAQRPATCGYFALLYHLPPSLAANR